MFRLLRLARAAEAECAEQAPVCDVPYEAVGYGAGECGNDDLLHSCLLTWPGGCGSRAAAAEGPGRGAPGAGWVLAVGLSGSVAEAGQLDYRGCVVRVVVQPGDGEHEVV